MFKDDKYLYMTDTMREFMERAQCLGLDVVVESSTGMVITLTGQSAMRVIIGADLGLNSSAAGRLCSDKYFASNILKQAGLNVIDSLILHDNDFPEVDQLTFPCIVKPNKGTGGDGVSSVSSIREMKSAIEVAYKYDCQVLVQKRYLSREFRIVVLDGALLYGYEKRPWQICGDGQASIMDFICLYNEQVNERYEISPNDIGLNRRLKNNHKTLSTILPFGETYDLFANANLKKGASSFPVEIFAPEYIEIVASACAVTGLRYGGVDLFAAQPEVFDDQYRIIEVNANPGFGFLRQQATLRTEVLDSLSEAVLDL